MLCGVDEALAAAAKLREEIDHLRRERLVFLGKLKAIHSQLDEQRAAEQAMAQGAESQPTDGESRTAPRETADNRLLGGPRGARASLHLTFFSAV